MRIAGPVRACLVLAVKGHKPEEVVHEACLDDGGNAEGEDDVGGALPLAS